MIDRLVHSDSETDVQRRERASTHFKKHPPLQVVAAMLDILREEAPAWLTQDMTLRAYPIERRMADLQDRLDVRQQLLVELTGTKPNTARKMSHDLQARILQIALEAEDIDAARVESACASSDLACYGDAAAMWRLLLSSLPWEDENEQNKRIVARMISVLVSPGRGVTEWSPSGSVLTPWDLISGIDPMIWHRDLPLEIRAAIHRAWLDATRDVAPRLFAPEHVLQIVTPSVFMQHFELSALNGIFKLAEKRLGFEEEPAPVTRFEGRSSAPPAIDEAAAQAGSPIADAEPEVDAETASKETAVPPPASSGMVAISDKPTTKPPPAEPAVARIVEDDPSAKATIRSVAAAEDGPDVSVTADAADGDGESVQDEELMDSEIASVEASPPDAVEKAKLLTELHRYSITFDAGRMPELDKLRALTTLIDQIMKNTYPLSQRRGPEAEKAAKDEMIVLLQLVNAECAATDRWKNGTVISVAGYVAKLREELRRASGEISPVSVAPRPKSTTAAPPPLPPPSTSSVPPARASTSTPPTSEKA